MPTPSALPRLFLIRHGNTQWAEAHRFTGRTDLPLNARGEEKARALAARLRGIQFVRVFVSPLQRARRTCQLAGFDAAAQVDPDLLEWDYGQFEGQFSAEVHKQNPNWSLFRDGAPAGESAAQVTQRADRFIARARAIEGDVAAFASGHIGRLIGARWIGQSSEAAATLLYDTAAICILSYEHDLNHPAIARWNDDGSPLT